MNKVKIVIHDCRDDESNVKIGVLPSGAPCVIDKLAVEADLLVSEGFIEPHFLGFQADARVFCPEFAIRVTVLGNHCSRFIHSENSRTGILDGNPMHEDMSGCRGNGKACIYCKRRH